MVSENVLDTLHGCIDSLMVWSPLTFATFVEYTEVVYITYTMATQDSPDIYALAEGTGIYIRQISCGHGITIT